MPDQVWFVLVFNDDATPMEFVVHLLQQVFRKDPAEAERIMLDTHNHGIAICDVFARHEEAVAKVTEANNLARQHGHLLQLRYACANGSLCRPQSLRRRALVDWLRKLDRFVWKAFRQGT
jgi:ATP-dependent Clp protease adapter protein ClpS